jgi:drug/metabolite transporter (DMT)-like permease
MVLFTLVALAGSLLILPIVIWEISQGGMLPHTTSAWTKLAGITLIASLANYLAFQHSVRVFGPPLAGTVLYTSTPASILLAVIFLGEDFRYYHAIGFVLVLGGVLLATLKLGSRKKT